MTVDLRLARSDPTEQDGWGYSAQGTHYYRARRSLCGRFRWNHGHLWSDGGAVEPGDCAGCHQVLARERRALRDRP